MVQAIAAVSVVFFKKSTRESGSAVYYGGFSSFADSRKETPIMDRF
jgi:hypothetical protein